MTWFWNKEIDNTKLFMNSLLYMLYFDHDNRPKYDLIIIIISCSRCIQAVEC